jgi:hypothetical protein
MKHLENYFKSEEEVTKYFDNEVFKFIFMCDNIMEFETLNPVIIEDDLITFKLSFYYEEGEAFFAYSTFAQWLDLFQLSEVKAVDSNTNERITMYFKEFETT